MFAHATLNVADLMFPQFGIRTDAGNAIGSQAKTYFPHMEVSYLVSDQSNFRNFPLIGRLPELRLRGAFGVAGRQPGLADKYRTYTFSQFPINNVSSDIANVYSVGNPKLSPEVSQEWELGFDATVFENARSRLNGTATLVHKHTSDLLSEETLPPSLGIVNSRWSNLGDAVNNSIEITIGGFQRIGKIDWTITNTFTTQNSKLLRLNNIKMSTTKRPVGFSSRTGTPEILRVGYPIDAVWAWPILGYVDVNENGSIEPSEIIYSDSARYLGEPNPRFNLTSQNQFTIANRLIITATLQYEDGGVVQSIDPNIEYSWVLNDPAASTDDLVRSLYDYNAYGYRVSTLRLQTLQVTYTVPSKLLARYLGKKSVILAVSGTNLGLWSTFSGMDPNLGGIQREQRTRVLPIPRTYGISVRVQ